MTDVMTATYIEDLLTPMPFEDAAEAMTAALADQLKAQPSDEVKALALAKTALETGRWQSIHRSNWGNIKAGTSYVGMYTAFACNEVLGGKLVWFSPRGRLDAKGGNVVAEAFDGEPWHPQTRFRAYANRFDGAYEYVEFIATGRYKVAWSRLLLGDVVGFVHTLKLAGYFTADEALYLKGVQGLYGEMLARVRGLPHEHLAPEIDHDAVWATIRGDQFAHVLNLANEDRGDDETTDPAGVA
jgi:hypothetical protein